MKTDWSHLDKYRTQHAAYESPKGATFGAFEVPYEGNSIILRIIATSSMDELGPPGQWEHVSVHVYDSFHAMMDEESGGERIPTWQEMAFVKDLFWNEDECVVQFHPAKKDYVNFHSCVLHLWRSTKEPFPMPPKVCV